MRKTILCTAESPWDRVTEADNIQHKDVEEIAGSQQDGWPSGDTVRMWCLHCKFEWTSELPQ
jgi:hypothetical protein